MAFTINTLRRRAAACWLLLGSLIALCLPLAGQAQVPAGTGAWSANQTWAADTVNGGNLSGYVYWPATQPVLASKRALVLVLHGCAQTASGDIINSSSDAGFNWKAMADQYGAVILAPNATGNLYGNHCWDYARSSHNRTTGHDGVLLQLVSQFISNAQYAIDPNQVYVAGLSSGGGQAMVLACLAPDVFAGVGINAGPPPGTTTGQISFVPSGYTSSTAANNCRNLAGANLNRFASQIASVIWGSGDYTVAQAYGPMAAAAMRGVYGGAFTQGAAATVATGGSNIPYTDSNGKLRTSEITVSGMGHAWPAGSGGQNTHFVDATKVNYPAFVMNFWFANNLRVSTAAAPVMTACNATVSGNAATISGAATNAAGPVTSYRVTLAGATPVNDPQAGSGASFSIGYALANGYYSGSVTASDSATGLTSAPCALSFLVGPAPALQAPSGLAAVGSSASTVALSWNAASGATGYHVYRDSARLTATAVAGTTYTATGLTAGTTYQFQVSSVGAGAESALSAAIVATTAPSFSCTATTASNYAHVQAGRASVSFGYALANGSNQNMGLWNIFVTTTLAQTSAGYYVIGTCP